MGVYVNPVNQSKEDWLQENSVYSASEGPDTFDSSPNHLPVCLINNGTFTAAGVACNERELMAFSDPFDSRPKEWYLVPIEKLLDPDVSDLHHYWGK